VLLRALEDNGLLNTPHGQVAVGWLVLEDLATVAILVLLPALVGGEGGGNVLQNALIAILKTALFVALMLFIGAKVMPWLLTRIAFTRSRELFILAVVALALGTAFGAAELFGVSLALGAFLAGVVVGESEVSHQVGAEVLPFREIFAVLFFVSVGMLVNPVALWADIWKVLVVTALIVVGKGITTVLMGLVLPASARTMLVVAAGLAQIGEFSFIVGQAGVALGILDGSQYGLILAGALLSIVLNPLLFRLLPRVEAAFQARPALWRLFERTEPIELPTEHGLADHVVVVGYGRVGGHIVDVLQVLEVPFLIVDVDAARAADLHRAGVPVLLGDAANSEILSHAGLERARVLVVTVPDETAAELIVISARATCPDLAIVARAATAEGVRRLLHHGARFVIQPELEGGLELVRHTLLTLQFPVQQVTQYVDAVRQDAYDVTVRTPHEQRMLDQLLATVRGMEIAWRQLPPDSPLVGQSLAQINLRQRVGASVIAVVRNHQMVANPKSNVTFEAGDILAVIGSGEQMAAVDHFLASGALPAPAEVGGDGSAQGRPPHG
jgi:CPA2 family monovalent cation:H+ antiporter-2